MTVRFFVSGLALLLVAACQVAPAAKRPAVLTPPPVGPQGVLANTRAIAVAEVTASLSGKVKIISNNGGAVITNNGSGIIGDNAGGLISNNGDGGFGNPFDTI